MKSTFNILFYPKRSKVTKNGEHPLYARVTINGRRLEFATKRGVPPGKWDAGDGKLKGNSEGAKSLNAYLETYRNDLYNRYREMIEKEIPINTHSMKSFVKGEEAESKFIVDLFETHNKQVKTRIGKEFAAATALRYETTLSHLKQFLKERYNLNDLPVAQIDHSFLSGFEYFLKTTRNCAHNTALKYIKNFKKIVRIAIASGWITRDPFLSFKSKLKHVEREFLTRDELTALEKKKLSVPRIENVRDIFVFSCYTGLAYADVAKLNSSNLVVTPDGEKWIYTFRTASNFAPNT